jgi:pimeloyl-ACP methyl ester carboxylesterase
MGSDGRIVRAFESSCRRAGGPAVTRSIVAATVTALLLGAVGVAAYPAEATTLAPKSCASMVGLTVPGSGMIISKAEEVPASAGDATGARDSEWLPVPLPAYCRVEGAIGSRTGPDGKHYGLTVAIALPQDWNGRFLLQGGGGLNGSLRPPHGADATGGRPALSRGFAVVSTDGGHRSARPDGSFMVDQQAALDFVFNAVPTVTSAAKRVVETFYGRPIQRSYFAGCSTGGREGMQAAQRYPLLFDGVITGAPAMRGGHSNLALKWAAVAFNRISARDETGKIIPGSAFSFGDRQLIVQGVLQACDALDGLRDGMIFNIGACKFDAAALGCKGAKAESCLDGGQVEALRRAFEGPASASGRPIYSRFPFDTGIAFQGEGIPGFLLNSTGGPVAAGGNPLEMDIEAEESAIHASPTQQLTDTYNWTNLSTFVAHSGKQLFYHGVSDPWFSALSTTDYYHRLAADNGGDEKVLGFARLFLVPGMGHCAGGDASLDQFDLLGALIDWVEQGKAPESVIATSRRLPGRSRPLCPWPAHAHYKGAGDVNAAASFECRR